VFRPPPIGKLSLTHPVQDYGFFTPTTQTALNNDFISNLGCSGTDTKCLSSLSVETILDAADTVRWDAPSLDPAASGGEWFRPVTDGSFITSPLDSTAAFPKQTKPILVTNVAEEAAYTIYGPDGFTDPVPPSGYVQAVSFTYSEDSTNKILNSTFYRLPPNMSKDANADTRPQLEILGTDGVWRCAGWTFARNWVNAGARVYVGMFAVGASYPGNSDASACAAPGAVCHQDDIKIVFGTVDSPTPGQSKAIAEVQARWGAFAKTGSPNPSGYPTWPQATTTDVKTIVLGNGSGAAAPVGGCIPDFWGTAVPYDYQVYGL
jgi:carboxylesterase type B